MNSFSSKSLLFSISLCIIFPGITYAETISPTLNGIKYPLGLNNWRVISTSYRTDNNTQRVILGNSIAIKAARSGNINPWPEGSVLAKLVWKNIQHQQWDAAIVPGEFVHSEIMIKDSKKYRSTGSWGYARWSGKKLIPYGENALFTKECVACHENAKHSDNVFTVPAYIP